MRAKTMKKPIVVLLFALLVNGKLFAQNEQPVRLGIMIAPNLGWIAPDSKNTKADGTLVGFNFGLMADFRLGNNNYALTSGLFYQTKVGAKYISQVNDSTLVRGHVRNQFVQIPLAIKLKTNEIGYATYFLNIGADFGFNVGAKGDITTTVNGRSRKLENEDMTDVTSLFRAALLVGGGLEYNFSGNTTALVGINYSNGFMNTFKKDHANARLHYLQLNLGFFF